MSERSPRGGLGRTALFGVVSQIASRGARALVGVATVAVLTRFLGPEAFGIAAIILFLVTFAQIFVDFGLRVALVKRIEVTPLEVDSVFWVSMGIGLLMAAGVWLGADLIARIFQEPQLTPYVKMVSGVFLFSAARGIPLTLLERNFRFPAIAASEITAAVVGSAVAIAAVLAGFGVEALIAQQIAMAVVPMVMNFVSARWMPRLQFSLEAIRPIIGFGLSLTATNAIGFLSGNIDRPLLATRLSAADLGLFTVAQQIVGTPIRTVAMNARRVTFPILSAVQDDNRRVLAAHRDSLHAMFFVLAPACFGLSALAEPVVQLVLGPDWGMVARLIGVSALSALLWSVLELNQAIFNVKGALRFMLRWSLFSLFSAILLIYAAAPYGLIVLVWVRLVYNLFATSAHCWFLARMLETGLVDLVRPLWRPVLASALMALLVYQVDVLLRDAGLLALVRVVAGALLGMALYAGLALLIDRERLFQLVARVRARKPDGPIV